MNAEKELELVDAFDEAEQDGAKGPLFLIRIGHTSACQMGYLGSQFA